MKTPEPALEWSAGIRGGFLSRYTYGRCLEAYRGIAVHIPGTSACHRGYKLFGETPGFPHARPLAPLPGAAQHCGSYRRSRRSRGGIRNQPRATAGFSAVPLADALCQLGIGSSAAPLEAVWDAAEPRLWLGAGDSPPLHSELPMAINVTPTSEGPGDTAQTASPSRSRLWPPEGPGFPPPRFPAGNGAAAGGLCAGLGGRSRPGGWRLTPRAARSCSASEVEAALGRPLRSRLPPSLGGQVPPASRWPAPGPICSRGRLLPPGTEAADGSGAKAALCQGAPDWLTGLRNGYLVRVKASDWSRGTCNASSEDAGVRVPESCRGAAAVPPGMAACSRRCPQHRPAPGALGPSRLHQQS